jgi:beta-1,4-N-acetylglucosaminyltransferase
LKLFKRLAKPKAVLLIYGTGGHETQMRRLIGLTEQQWDDDIQKVAIVEPGAQLIDGISCGFELTALRSKQRSWRSGLQSVVCVVSSVYVLWRVIRQFDIRCAITTGPGIAIPIALMLRLVGKKIVHIETWSRFCSKSLTGRFMYHLATTFNFRTKHYNVFTPRGYGAAGYEYLCHSRNHAI